MGVSGKRVLPTGSRPPLFSETKFLAPRIRSTLVPRASLVDKLVRTDAQTLTMVVGPAGAGKSSVLAEWYCQSDDGSVAWLSADRNDADPTRFWRAFIAAVQTVEPTFGVDAADAMTLDGMITPDALESLLVDDQIELSRRTRLVIDDFQFVSPDAVLQLRQLLERGLSNLCRRAAHGEASPVLGSNGSVCGTTSARSPRPSSDSTSIRHAT
jgi:LuxR family maltose regulon positive regulatory protein